MSSREHQQAQELAAQAGLLADGGRWSEGIPLYEKAAQLESQALDRLPAGRPRTRGVLGVSVASLLYKARRLDEAEAAIQTLLSRPDVSPAARRELQAILQAIGEGRAGNGQGYCGSGEVGRQPTETGKP